MDFKSDSPSNVRLHCDTQHFAAPYAHCAPCITFRQIRQIQRRMHHLLKTLCNGLRSHLLHRLKNLTKTLKEYQSEHFHPKWSSGVLWLRMMRVKFCYCFVYLNAFIWNRLRLPISNAISNFAAIIAIVLCFCFCFSASTNAKHYDNSNLLFVSRCCFLFKTTKLNYENCSNLYIIETMDRMELLTGAQM